jgi:hypothetical protein
MKESFTVFCDAVSVEPAEPLPSRADQLCLCLTNVDLSFLEEELSIKKIIQVLGKEYLLEQIGRAYCLLHFEVTDPLTINHVYTGTEE